MQFKNTTKTKKSPRDFTKCLTSVLTITEKQADRFVTGAVAAAAAGSAPALSTAGSRRRTLKAHLHVPSVSPYL